ncbi:unnamed protein product [Blepharisma stoltei]|uniref:Uncharacterized protein n=1 Tax=Blepharisma stoltei TaxID=1481888 RepID=A0AAU9KBB2_9CILI|nr:unnamed protein product [Blepharisma stoltei]
MIFINISLIINIKENLSRCSNLRFFLRNLFFHMPFQNPANFLMHASFLCSLIILCLPYIFLLNKSHSYSYSSHDMEHWSKTI